MNIVLADAPELSATPRPTGKAAKSKPPKNRPNQKKPRRTKTVSGTSKQDRVIAMLRRKQGATVAAIMKVTDWQKHSVHGFFAGVVRKKLGLNLVSDKSKEDRVYRLVAGKVKPSGHRGR